MSLRFFFRALSELTVSSFLCLKVAYTNYNDFRDRIEEILTKTSRETIKTDPLAEMVLGSMIGCMLLIPHFNLVCGILIALTALLSFAQVIRVPIHGCLYASILYLVGAGGFILKSFLYFSGAESTFILALPIVLYMTSSIIFYVFRCLDEGVTLVIKKDFYELIKLVLFGILIKLA